MHRKGERWKLIDFEASRTIGEECVGVITPRYCPPEVARATTYGLEGANGVVATPSVDLWALGCVIYVSFCNWFTIKIDMFLTCDVSSRNLRQSTHCSLAASKMKRFYILYPILHPPRRS